MRNPDPFRYPQKPHSRRHGPKGYSSYERFRDWLRDEFDFRCIYCLRREIWGQLKGEFDIDHLIPRVLRPDLETEYDNLVYSCHTCNLAKSSSLIADPHAIAYGKCLKVNDDGTISAVNRDGEILIGELDLDAATKVRWRKLWIDSVRLAQQYDHARLRIILGLPESLPNLATMKPPLGNCRSVGLSGSWYAKLGRGEIYEIFE